MKMLLTVEIPHEPFNTLVRNGTAGPILERILEAIKPEALTPLYYHAWILSARMTF